MKFKNWKHGLSKEFTTEVAFSLENFKEWVLEYVNNNSLLIRVKTLQKSARQGRKCTSSVFNSPILHGTVPEIVEVKNYV